MKRAKITYMTREEAQELKRLLNLLLVNVEYEYKYWKKQKDGPLVRYCAGKAETIIEFMNTIDRYYFDEKTYFPMPWREYEKAVEDWLNQG